VSVKSTAKKIKETHKYHVSLETPTDRRFELRGISPSLEKPFCEGEKPHLPSGVTEIKNGRDIC
jgi:hypothetical protein